MGQAKPAIQSLFDSRNFDYYITAAPVNRIWSQEGGRYYRDGFIVGQNAREPSRLVDLSRFSQIIFVGQWIQPFQYLQGVNIASSALLKSIFHDNCFIDLPSGACNEPLSLFSDVVPNKCSLIVDPLPYSRVMSKVPNSYMRIMYEKLEYFCQKRGIRFFMPPSELLEDGRLLTKRIYSRKNPEDKNAHCSDDYWSILFSSISESLFV